MYNFVDMKLADSEEELSFSDLPVLESIGSHPDVQRINDRWVCQVCHASAFDRSILEEVPCKGRVESEQPTPKKRKKQRVGENLVGDSGFGWVDIDSEVSFGNEPYSPDIGHVWYERGTMPWIYVEGHGWTHPSGTATHTYIYRANESVSSTVPFNSGKVVKRAKYLAGRVSLSGDIIRQAKHTGAVFQEALDHAKQSLDSEMLLTRTMPITRFKTENEYDERYDQTIITVGAYVLPYPTPIGT